MTEIFLGISKFFKWTFQLLPIIGTFVDWIFVLAICLFLIYWCKRIINFGQNDKNYDGDRL